MPRKNKFLYYFDHLLSFYRKHKYIPSCKEAMDVLGVKSMSVAYRFYQQMVENNFFIHENSKFIPTDQFTGLPAFDSIPAGFASPAHDPNKYTINLESYLVPNPNVTFFLKVVGDSMKDAGIVEGDHVIVDREKKAYDGDVVVAEIDGGYTLKYLMSPQKNPYLLPANQNYQPIYPKEKLSILGVVVGVFRTYL